MPAQYSEAQSSGELSRLLIPVAPAVRRRGKSSTGDLVLLLICFIGTFVGVALGGWVAVSLSPKPVAASGAEAGPTLDLVSYSRGKLLFNSTCVACHGAGGMGVAKLGKDLIRSKFVHRATDLELASLITTGRPTTDPRNTTGVPMPPRGGNAKLRDKDVSQIVVYLRGLAAPLSVPEGEAPASALADLMPEASPAPAAVAATEPPPAAPPSAAIEAGTPTPAPAQPASIASAGAADPEAINRGKRAYISCMACHGKDATGIKGMGKDLVHSQFVARLSDDDLLTFIKKGRGPTDPDNTTKVGMPSKGGNPALNDRQIKDLIAYIRSLKQT